MDKPTEWYIGYEDKDLWDEMLKKYGGIDDIDPADVWTEEDAETYDKAVALAKERFSEGHSSVSIYKRYDIHQQWIRVDEWNGYFTWEWESDSSVASVDDEVTVYQPSAIGETTK